MTHRVLSLALAIVVATGVATSVHGASEPTSVEAAAGAAAETDATGLQAAFTQGTEFMLRITTVFRQQGELTDKINNLKPKVKGIGGSAVREAYSDRISTLQGHIEVLKMPAAEPLEGGSVSFKCDETTLAILTQAEAALEEIATDIQKLDKQLDRELEGCCSWSSCCSRRGKHKAE